MTTDQPRPGASIVTSRHLPGRGHSPATRRRTRPPATDQAAPKAEIAQRNAEAWPRGGTPGVGQAAPKAESLWRSATAWLRGGTPLLGPPAMAGGDGQAMPTVGSIRHAVTWPRGGKPSANLSTAIRSVGRQPLSTAGDSRRHAAAWLRGGTPLLGRPATAGVGGRALPKADSPRPGTEGSWFGPLRGPGALLTWLLLFFPLWWLLGLGGLIFFIAAVPMALALLRRNRVEIPPGFGIWLVFCLVVIVSTVAIGLTPEGTVAGSWTGRILGVAFRLVGYASATVICLYAVNLSESDFPRRRLVNLLAVTGVITVAGGLLGTFAGHWEFTSPLEALLPGSLASDQFVQSLVHPQAAQVMDFLGYDTPRPAAPWGYTNTWGNMLAIAAPWIAVAVACYRTSSRVKLAAIAILTVALVPAVYSMNRGLWLNLAVAGAFVAFRFLASGRWWPLTALGVASVVALAAVLVTPLGQVVTARFANGHSDDGRGYSTMRALEALPESPVLGFGSTRQTVGSGESIAVGPTPECPRCGGRTLGGNGQLWQLLFAHGLAGALAYVGFFLAVLWRFRRDHSAIGIVASMAMLLSLTSMFYYNALVAPLAITLLCYALLWRNERDRAVKGTT